MQNIPGYRWPPTQRLLAARFLANLEQLQNRDFAISNRSKPIGVLTRTKSLFIFDRLPICYHLPDFQLIWSNFKIEIFQLQIALNPYEFWRARNARVAMITYPWATRCPIFSRFKGTFWLHFTFFSLPGRKGVDTLGGFVLVTLCVILFTLQKIVALEIEFTALHRLLPKPDLKRTS